eukprot:TRINITY_DN6467_c0_g1_i2.p1 TRINITY_DN6467_c0_g1~~TRINITY_DN6467_c0_g1_i2.p1  ORF type:complete len:180 (-),score=8.53 TRINITY_DN6467_c0_g1_i2:41-580(-)
MVTKIFFHILECSRRNGVWHNETLECLVYKNIDFMCLKVTKNNNTWVLENKFGCGIFTSDWAPANYSIVKPNINTRYNLPIETVIRSANDPYIIAAKITDGSFNFTYPDRYLYYSSGFACFAVAFILLILMILPLFKCLEQRKKMGSYVTVQDPSTRSSLRATSQAPTSSQSSGHYPQY